jgi:Uma2 family endonuclease
MGMPAQEPVTTIEQLLALPDDGMRHELLDGEHVVTPAPSLLHQRVLARIYDQLRPAVGASDTLDLLWSPADIHLGPRTLVQPDLFIVRRPAAGLQAEWKDVSTPLLAMEVLSPTTAARDRGTKRRLYLEAGVEQYWIVDTDARLVERWRAGEQRPEMVDTRLVWELSAGVSGAIDVGELFG